MIAYFSAPHKESTMMHDAIDGLLERFPSKGKECLIQVLQEVQELEGYLSDQSIRKVSEYLTIPASRIYSIATFYDQFRFTPQGRYHIRICRGTACHVLGSSTILAELEKQLGITAGNTTRSGMFSLEVVSCMGACSLSPVISINGTFYDHVTLAKIRDILLLYRNREEGENGRD